MKILQGLIPLIITFSLGWGAEDKSKKEKTGVKRQIGYGLEAIPGLAAIHTPLSEDTSLLAIGRPTAHGGLGVVHPVGIIHKAPPIDNIGGFTSYGFDALHGGFGVYAAPHAILAPINVAAGPQPKTVQLDQGWKGIDYGRGGGHGSIEQGHKIAQSLVSNAGAHAQHFYDIAPGVPQFDFKGKNAGVFSQNSLAPFYSSFGDFPLGAKAPVHTGKSAYAQPIHGIPAQKGYIFAMQQFPHQGVLNGNPSNHHIPGHIGPHSLGNVHGATHPNNVLHSPHTGHASGHNAAGHGSISHGHQIAKTVHVQGHSGFSASHGAHKAPNAGLKHGGANHFTGYNTHHANVHSYGKKTAAPAANSYHVPSSHGLTHHVYSHIPAGSSRNSHLHSGEHTHDSTSHSSSYNSDFSPPSHTSYPSSEQLDSPYLSHSNGHGGSHHSSGENKATSFQSFIIHSYKPGIVNKKKEYDSHESDENFSGPSYNSAQAASGESHFN